MVNQKDGSELILVPAGEFVMGSDEGDEDEKPPHTVHLDEYYIGKYQVTNAQYTRFVKKTGHDTGIYWKKYANPGREKYPVACVSWRDAIAYAKWAGLRLPSEAEWEKAARGTDGREYPWGDYWEKNSCCNSALNHADVVALMRVGGVRPKFTIPVGSIPAGASPYGVMDMAGNVWEWCQDWYGPYVGGSQRNPKGPESGFSRVLRGGSWSRHNSRYFRCSNRGRSRIDSRSHNFGFRVAGDVLRKEK